MFFSLLAASADGFVSGFVIGSTGIKFGFYDFIKSFGIVFSCCIIAAVTGNFLAQTQLQMYINIMGVIVMLGLAWNALHGDINNADTKITAVALSVAVDASIVCLYLTLCGYNVLLVSFLGAFMHSVLMWLAAAISNRIIKEKWLLYTKYISGAYFLCMAVYKLSNL